MASTLLIIAILVLAVVGASAEQVTIRLAVDAGRLDIYSKLASQFEAENPNIRVEVSPTMGHEDLMVQIISGLAPDVTSVPAGAHAILMENDMLADLQGYVDRDWTEADIADMFPSVWSGIYPEGVRYGIPMYLNVPLFWYNADLFDEAGLTDPMDLEAEGAWTWAALKDAAAKLTKREADDSIEVIGFRTSFVGSSFISRPTWIWANGGDVFDLTADPIRFMMTETPTIEAMEFIYDTIWVDRSQAVASERNLYAFDAERLAIFDDGIHQYRSWNERIGDSFRYGLAPRPMGAAGRGNRTSYDVWVMPINTEHPEAAWKLIDFLTSTESQSVMATELYLGPVRRSAAQAFIEASPKVDMRVYLEAASTARVDPAVLIPRWSDFERIVQPALVAVFEAGEKSPRVAIEEVAPAVEALYR